MAWAETAIDLLWRNAWAVIPLALLVAAVCRRALAGNLAPVHGDGGASAEVRLPAGKAIIASSLNLTPETFSRELHQLAGRGLIDVKKKTIRVHNLAALGGSP